MSDVVISVEKLGKKYTIGHSAQREPYTALRDVLAGAAHTALRKARDLIHGRPIIEGDEFEELWALRDVSFEVRRGEVIGIIGRNGAGKSTLLKILSRITEPSEGRVSIRGRVASLLEVGTGFHPELSGRENIFLNGSILGMTHAEIRKKLDEIVAFAEVEKFLDTPVKRYSSGMYVRLAFAVAAHLEPAILIVDEVLAVGDAEFQKKCLGKMKDVAGHGRTVLFVSHNLTAVSSLCERGMLMRDGRIIMQGAIEGAVTKYLETNLEQRQYVRRSSKTILSSATLHSIENDPRGRGWRVQFDVELSTLPRLQRIGLDFVLRQNNHALAFGGSAYFEPVSITPDIRRVRCVVGPLNFAIGNYILDLYVCDPMRAWLEEHISILQFTIERQAGSEGSFQLHADRNIGMIIAPQEWIVLDPKPTLLA